MFPFDCPDHRFRFCQKSERSDVDPLWHPGISGTRDYPQQGISNISYCCRSSSCHSSPSFSTFSFTFHFNYSPIPFVLFVLVLHALVLLLLLLFLLLLLLGLLGVVVLLFVLLGLVLLLAFSFSFNSIHRSFL